MTELSTLEKGRFLVSVQKDMSKVEITQMNTSNKLTEMLQVLADQSLSESERMAFFSEVAGYVQIASLFLAPLLVVGGILAAGGAFSALLGSIESSAQLTQGALAGTQGALEAASSEKRANIQKDKTATTTLQRSMDDALNCLENQKEMAQKHTEGALKILNNDARMGRQKTVQ
ncbi:MAG: hypothetical protein ACRDDW_00335 [Candidatus Rhabdochlamydia sp.]